MEHTIERLEADVVIVGGGLAGSVAALQAHEQGADVLVVETSNTYRSGHAGAGLDHIFSYVPEVHEKVGYTKEDMKKDMRRFSNLDKGLGYTELSELFVEKSYERIMGLKKYGINFDFGGRYLVNGYRLVTQFHTIPTSFNFDGRDIKVKLTEAMKKEGIRILNRVQCVKILTSDDGRAAGIIGISTREKKIVVVTGKTVVIATSGMAGRLGERPSSTYTHWERNSASSSGAGISLPLRAGAEVVNLEFSLQDSSYAFEGFNFSVGAPGGSWWPAARLIDEEGNVVVERTYELNMSDPDYVSKNRAMTEKYDEQKARMFRLLSEGKELYVDFSEADDDEIKEIEHALANEGQMWLWLQNLHAEGLSLKKIRIPYRHVRKVKVFSADAGVLVDVHCETTVSGLFAAGDITGARGFGDAPCAVVYGYEAGLQAAIKALSTDKPVWDESQLKEITELIDTIYDEDAVFDDGSDTWQQAEGVLQGIVGFYGRSPITDGKVSNALDKLAEIRKELNLKANNPHDLGKCFEILTLLDSAEAIFKAADIRTTGFGSYRREHKGSVRANADKELYGLYYDKAGELAYSVHESGIA